MLRLKTPKPFTLSRSEPLRQVRFVYIASAMPASKSGKFLAAIFRFDLPPALCRAPLIRGSSLS
jgi:hypothetical protein